MAQKAKKAQKTPRPTGGKGGRPKGAATKKRIALHVPAAACPRCGSTKRTNFRGSPVLVKGPVQNPTDGRWYARKIGRRTCCAACGQHRMQWSYEDRV